MKIRRINLIDGNYIRVGDFATECHGSIEFLVTEIKEEIKLEPEYGYQIFHNDILLGSIHYHAVTMVFYEVENES